MQGTVPASQGPVRAAHGPFPVAFSSDRRSATTTPAATAGCSAAQGRSDDPGVQATACQRPGRDRVRVPHLPGVQFVPAPDRGGHRGEHGEQAPAGGLVGSDASRAFDGFRDVGDRPVPPAVDLVAEESRASRPTGADRSFSHHTTITAAHGPNRRHLDHPRVRRENDLQRRVVQVNGGATLPQRAQRFEDASVPTDRMPARPEREPVQVHPGGRPEMVRWRHRRLRPQRQIRHENPRRTHARSRSSARWFPAHRQPHDGAGDVNEPV
jgi:hypothetical protein